MWFTIVNRGGCYAFSSAPTSPRDNYGGGDNDYTSFRVILYL